MLSTKNCARLVPLSPRTASAISRHTFFRCLHLFVTFQKGAGSHWHSFDSFARSLSCCWVATSSLFSFAAFAPCSASSFCFFAFASFAFSIFTCAFSFSVFSFASANLDASVFSNMPPPPPPAAISTSKSYSEYPSRNAFFSSKDTPSSDSAYRIATLFPISRFRTNFATASLTLSSASASFLLNAPCRFSTIAGMFRGRRFFFR
mmetsp:Transcript_17282/g.42956  ORF Transcript_17282/g.42956 Transcript_17282/m.42956 type:complete len:205 (-) Transcript_17282:631-1245(-)